MLGGDGNPANPTWDAGSVTGVYGNIGTATSYDLAVTPGQRFYVQVWMNNSADQWALADGSGATGNYLAREGYGAVTGVTSATPQPAPAAPAGLHAVNLGYGVGDDQVELIWQNSSDNEDGFIVEHSFHSEFTNSTTTVYPVDEDQVGPDVTTFVGDNPAVHTVVFYRVCAFRGNSRSSWVSTFDLLPHSPFAVAVSWLPNHFPFATTAATLSLAGVANPPPMSNFLDPYGQYDPAEYQAWLLNKDFRNILQLQVAFSVDPYSGAFQVSPLPNIEQIAGSTPTPLGNIPGDYSSPMLNVV